MMRGRKRRPCPPAEYYAGKQPRPEGAETVEQYLARGGEITRAEPGGAAMKQGLEGLAAREYHSGDGAPVLGEDDRLRRLRRELGIRESLPMMGEE